MNFDQIWSIIQTVAPWVGGGLSVFALWLWDRRTYNAGRADGTAIGRYETTEAMREEQRKLREKLRQIQYRERDDAQGAKLDAINGTPTVSDLEDLKKYVESTKP
jgi:ribosomal protein L19E